MRISPEGTREHSLHHLRCPAAAVAEVLLAPCVPLMTCHCAVPGGHPVRSDHLLLTTLCCLMIRRTLSTDVDEHGQAASSSEVDVQDADSASSTEVLCEP